MRIGRAVGAVLALWAGAEGERLVLDPPAGTRIVRVWSEYLRLELDTLEMTLDGQPVNVTFEELDFVQRRGLEFADVIERCTDGRLRAFERTYDTGELGFELEVDGQSMASVVGSNASAETRVRFEHDAEQDTYEREIVEGPLDPGALEGLAIEADLTALLPGGEVEEGATWTLEPEVLREFFAGGGELGFAPTQLSTGDLGVPGEVVLAGTFASLHELFLPGSELSGRAEARYAGIEKGLARIDLELELDVLAHAGAKFSTFAMSGWQSERTLDIEAEVEGKLRVLWNVAAKRLESALFRGEVALEAELSFPLRLRPDAAPVTFEGTYELAGEAEVELAVR